tara:strand:+ start:300 stop:518 length:219 start_codon:yes stop_codon:yes gene_type:complete
MTKISFNGEVRDMTSQEEADATSAFNEIKKLNDANIAAVAKKKADSKTGNQKLLDLGLTQDEATALTGYKPE